MSTFLLDENNTSTENERSFSISKSPSPAIRSPLTILQTNTSEGNTSIEGCAIYTPQVIPYNNEVSESDIDSNITHDSESEEREETEEERINREIAESERYAWELMQEESRQAYQMQVDFISQNANQMSEEDRMALEMILQEEQPRNASTSEQEEAHDADNEEANLSDNPDNWTYDQLLTLGEVLGDVKTDRWRQRSANVIDSLPVCTYEELLKNKCCKSLELNCAICREVYENESKVNLLPCSHYFHVECGSAWLDSHNSCPMCKEKVTQSP